MAKKSQLDKAIDALVQRKVEILAKCNAECEAIDASIRVVASQQVRRPRKPKVADMPDRRTQSAGA